MVNPITPSRGDDVDVVISSRKAEACQEVADGINAGLGPDAPNRAVVIPAHIGDKAALQNLVDETHAQLGNIDILVCNAAVNPYYGPSKDIPDAAFEKIMNSNVLSNHWLCHMVLPEMEARGDGSIMIVSSIGGLHASTVIGTYNISKAADFQMVRNLSAEYGPKGIRVNAIAPGLIKTDFARALWENPDTLKRATSTTPLRRIGEPVEIAGETAGAGEMQQLVRPLILDHPFQRGGTLHDGRDDVQRITPHRDSLARDV